MRRRTLLAHGFALTPLAALMLSACGDDGDWAEGMLPIKWDRDTCLHCMMVISDRRFAVEIRGGHRNDAFKFDDIGCAATWRVEKMNQYPLMIFYMFLFVFNLRFLHLLLLLFGPFFLLCRVF